MYPGEKGYVVLIPEQLVLNLSKMLNSLLYQILSGPVNNVIFASVTRRWHPTLWAVPDLPPYDGVRKSGAKNNSDLSKAVARE